MNLASSVLPIEIRVRRMYGRYLSSWAMDLMALRRQNLAEPSARVAADELTLPDRVDAREERWTTGCAASWLTWRAPGAIRNAA